MGWAAKGLYRELLDEAWKEGSIPSDMEALADICGCPVKTMREAWKEIEPCWELRGDRYFSDKLDAQRTEKDAVRVARVQAGRIGGLVKTINKLESEGADQEDIERVKRAEVEARDNLAGAKQQLIDSQYLEQDSKQTLANASKSKQTLANDDVCHIARAYAEHTQEQEQPTALAENPPTRPEDYANCWNRHRGPLPKVLEFTDSRRKKVLTRQRQGISLEQFERAVKQCVLTPFLAGDNDRGWVADFDWLIENDKNALKVLEGKYGGGTGAGRANGKLESVKQSTIAAEQRIRDMGFAPASDAGDSDGPDTVRRSGSSPSGDGSGSGKAPPPTLDGHLRASADRVQMVSYDC